ncbi:hypothetical protein DFJ73DRAFT_819010 [Zopfochytrium polystomum]|nr:hypothetical protein DFJ73DRAFT_819010 [Zopfochytrium polystomum]
MARSGNAATAANTRKPKPSSSRKASSHAAGSTTKSTATTTTTTTTISSGSRTNASRGSSKSPQSSSSVASKSTLESQKNSKTRQLAKGQGSTVSSKVSNGTLPAGQIKADGGTTGSPSDPPVGSDNEDGWEDDDDEEEEELLYLDEDNLDLTGLDPNEGDEEDASKNATSKKNRKREDGFTKQTPIVKFASHEREDGDDEDDGNAPDLGSDVEGPAGASKRKRQKAASPGKPLVAPANTGGVVYLGRIPHGFYEAEMLSYFKQFGEVVRLKLSRSKKTGKSKHYAFIEFENEGVAKHVVEAMNGYLLFNHILQCKLVPRDEVHPLTFAGADRPFTNAHAKQVASQRKRQNAPKSRKDLQIMSNRLLKTERQKLKKLKKKGIDYSLDLVGGTKSKSS